MRKQLSKTKKGRILSLLLAAMLTVSGCAGGGVGDSAGAGSPSASGTASGSESMEDAAEQGSEFEEEAQGEYARAMAKRSQSSENSDPTIISIAASEGKKGKKGKAKRKACTVMIYMVGSNLESRLGNATKDLEEIDGAGLGFENYNVIVYTGGSARWVGDVPCDRNCVLDMSRKGDERIVAQTGGNANMGLPETMSAFLNYCGENYPADHNALILWDHGGGPLWGYGVDELYDSDALLLTEMRAAMDGSVFHGGTDGKKLDMVGFDACLMGSLECMTIWKDYAEYYVGSEELEPGDGWNYAFLKVLEEPGIYSDSVTFAKSVGDSVLTSFEDYYEGKKSDTFNPDLTLACIDLGGIDALNASIDTLAEKMADDVSGGGYTGLMKDRSDIKSFGMTRSSEGTVSFFYDLVDVGDFANHMEAFYPEEAAAVREALGAAVARKYANIDDSSGMTLYYPYKNKGQFEQLGSYYEGLVETNGYSGFLKASEEQFLRSKSWDWDLGVPEDHGDEYTLQLTPEQLENMSEATYTIMTGTDEYGGYTPVMENCRIEPDKNGVLHLDKNVQLVVLENGDSRSIVRAVEIETDRKRRVYNTKGICLRSDLLYLFEDRITDLEFASVTIRLSSDKKSSETQIQNIELEDDVSGISAGKNSVDLMNWEGLDLLYGMDDLVVPARDGKGRIRPYDEWINPDISIGSLVPVNSEVELSITDIDDLHVEGAVCQLVIRDVNGEKYAAETVPIGGDNRKKVTVPVGDGSMEFTVLEDHAELVGYNGRETRIEVPETVEGVPVTEIGGDAFSRLTVFDVLGYNPVTEVILPDTVTRIGSAAFAYCRDLRRINTPASLKEVGNGAFMYCLSLESFELPDSVEKIGKCAFAYCESLTKFRIPRGLILMEEGAFMHCTALAEFTGDPKTGGTAGSTDDAENEGNFPILAEDGAVYTGDGAMLLAYPCAAGIRFKVKEGTKEIGYGTFDGTSLEEVVLPGSLTKIGNYAFYGCEHLKAPAFPEGLKQLGMHCFDVQEMFFNPEDIPEEQDVIRIPASLEEIGEHAFDRFINARFEVSEDNRHYSAVDGALMNKAGDTLYYIATGPDFRAVYPDGTVEFKEDPLDAYASVSIYFTDIKEQIYLPASMTKFPEKLSNILYNTGDDTIYHCPAGSEAEKFAIRQGLRFTNEMGIPEGTAELPTQKGTMFFDLYSDHAVLTGYSGEDETLEIPAEVEGKDVTAAGNGIEPLFSSYSSIYGTDRLAPALKKCVIPEGVTDINEQAFREVSGIELILPSTLRRIGREALNINLNLSSLPEGLEILESDFGWSAGDPFTVTSKMRFTDGTCLPSVSSFELEGKNENYSVRDGVLYNADGSVLLRYPSEAAAEEFSVPEGTVSLGKNAFCDAKNLRKISLPGSVRQIGEGAFSDCYSLSEITFGEGISLETIGKSAFSNCDSLTEISLPGSLKRIGDQAFYGCTGLTGISLPGSLRQIGDDAFYGCTGLTEITYEEGASLERIGENAFTNCSGLTEISLPPVKEIKAYAFMNCESLTTVQFAEGTRSIGDSAFEGTAVAAPQFPESLVRIGEYAYGGYHCFILEGSAETIRIPAGVSEIGTKSFGAVGNIAFEVDPENTYYSSVDGLLLDRDKNVFYLCPAGKKGTVTVPEGVTVLMRGVFDCAPEVTDVEIPDSVICIVGGSFDPIDVDDGNGGKTKVYPITIHCSKGSYAEKYAISRGIPYEAK